MKNNRDGSPVPTGIHFPTINYLAALGFTKAINIFFSNPHSTGHQSRLYVSIFQNTGAATVPPRFLPYMISSVSFIPRVNYLICYRFKNSATAAATSNRSFPVKEVILSACKPLAEPPTTYNSLATLPFGSAALV
jgi:hypothetical protein